jgi:hypothetical protein
MVREAAVPVPEIQIEQQPEIAKAEPRPWIRYFARLTDLMFLSFALGFILALVAPNAIEQTPDAVFGFVVIILMIPVEAVLLLTMGTTPGKALFRIIVKPDNQQPITTDLALKRAFLAAMGGLAFGIPILSLITLIRSHSYLTANGKTKYDQELGISVYHGPISTGRVVAIVLVLVAIVTLIAIGLGS